MIQNWGVSHVSLHSQKPHAETWGDIGREDAEAFCTALMRLPHGVWLNMADLEIDDGPALAQVISTLRQVAPGALIEPPRMLAHTLYKINGLKTIQLVRPRSY